MTERHPGSDPPELVAEVRRAREVHVATQLLPAERGWRLSPEDGGDPAEVSPLALERELDLLRRTREQLPPAGDRGRAAGEETLARRALRHRLKHFPVLFVSAPHVEDGAGASFPGIPTPLLYATSVLDRHLRIDEFPALRVPEVVAVLNPPAYDEAFRARLRAEVRRHRPRLVGISNVSEGHHYCLEIARTVKALTPEAIVLVGGAHEDGTNPEVYRQAAERTGAGRRGLPAIGREHVPVVEALHTLADEDDRRAVDFVAAGDGPFLLMELVRLLAMADGASADALRRAVRASAASFGALEGCGHLFFRQPQGSLEHVSLSGRPLDRTRLPFMSYARLSHENRFPVFRGKRTAQVMTCFGCKYSCAFCHESADQVLYGSPKLQRRTSDNVVRELDLRVEQGYEAVFFDDSTFTQSGSYVRRLASLMAERARTRWTAPLEWGCQTTLGDLDRPLVEAMAASGCSYVYFGLESINPGRLVHKAGARGPSTSSRSWARRFCEVAQWCHECGVRVGASVQFGLGESERDRQITIGMLAELQERGWIEPGCIGFNVNAPYPGTRQWIDLLVRGAPLPDYRQRLVRRRCFETGHQFSSLRGGAVDRILAMLHARFGDLGSPAAQERA